MTAPTEAPWGPGKPPFIIAEIGLTHEGSLGNALAFIDACADAGASAVKFQCHDGDCNTQFRNDFVWHQDACRQDYWQRTRFTLPEWQDISYQCKLRNVACGITPFSMAALFLVGGLCDFIKIARQWFDTDLHKFAKHQFDPPRHVLHTGPGGLGLNQYNPRQHIGISDHSGHIGPAMDSIKGSGAQVAELHVCWDRRQFGPDVACSVTIDELAELVRAVR